VLPVVLHSRLSFMHGIGTFRTDSMQAVIAGMCFLLLRLAPGLGALLRCNLRLSQVWLPVNLY
jgi:hypothetical protein